MEAREFLMFLVPGPVHLLQVLFFVVGVIWCYKVIWRWQEDLRELREVDDKVRKVVIVGVWAATVVIAILVVSFAVSVIVRIASGIAGFEIFF